MLDEKLVENYVLPQKKNSKKCFFKNNQSLTVFFVQNNLQENYTIVTVIESKNYRNYRKRNHYNIEIFKYIQQKLQCAV